MRENDVMNFHEMMSYFHWKAFLTRVPCSMLASGKKLKKKITLLLYIEKKSSRMKWVGHVARTEEWRGVHKVLVGKP